MPSIDHLLRPFAGGEYFSTMPSRRFPIYTRGNAGEVFPEPYYPLTFSTAYEPSVAGMQKVMTAGGAINQNEIDSPHTAIGVFGGYAYLNLSLSRLLAVRFPKGDAQAVDDQLLGNSEAPPYVKSKADKSLIGTLKATAFLLHCTRIKELPELDADKRRVDAWRRGLPDPATASDAELVTSFRKFDEFFTSLWERHLLVSSKVTVPLAGVTQLVENRLGDPRLATRLFAGIGDIESAAPSTELFELGRLVASDATLTEHFDRGVSGLLERLSTVDSPETRTFLERFDGFLERFGSRGPNEWDVASVTWGMAPEMPLALIDRMRSADDDHDPRIQQARLAREREQAIEETLSQLKPWEKGQFKQMLTAGTALSQGRERAKTTIVAAIHETRIRVHELARRVAERTGRPADDLFYVVDDELDAYLADPAAFVTTIDERRRMRDLLKTRIPPFIIDGEVPPFEEWERRDADVAGAGTGEVMAGIGGCPGVARGRARVILDPSDPGALGPGDVLVAPITDPAWTPLFVPAEAVVVDVGALISHAVIVSRELGIPAVVSVTNATRRIPDGALIEVDGDSGTVTILELP